MAPPMVKGADVAHVQAWVAKQLHAVRLPRAPFEESLPQLTRSDRAALQAVLTRRLPFDRQKVAGVALELSALVNYYEAIGSEWDARRTRDVHDSVSLLLQRICLLGPTRYTLPKSSAGFELSPETERSLDQIRRGREERASNV